LPVRRRIGITNIEGDAVSTSPVTDGHVQKGETMASTVVCVKLVAAELQALDQLVVLKGLNSRSAALRAGLGLLFEGAKLKRAAEQEIERQRRRHRPRHRRAWGKGLVASVTDFDTKTNKKKLVAS
jgi:hypothetical protein